MALESKEITSWDLEDYIEVAESELLDMMLMLEQVRRAMQKADDTKSCRTDR